MAASAGTSASSPILSPASPLKLAGFPPRRAENLPVPVLSLSRSRLRSYGTSFRVLASVSTPNVGVRTGPEDLVASIISKVSQSDRGVLLKKEEHDKVAEEARELQKYCVDEPVKCPLIFGEWDVAYCSVPTSPGGGYRSAFGRIFLKTTEMIQGLEAPDIVRNKVAFSLLGLVDGEVSLTGKLKALNDEWVQVIFEPPELKFGSLEFRYGGESEVKLQITYIDDKIRLGKGSRGSLFVFIRRN